MRIALVSDTHGVCREELMEYVKGCDCLIHTGDFDSERIYRKFEECGVPMYAVRGNCDHGELGFLSAHVSVGADRWETVLSGTQPGRSAFDLTDADFVVFRAYTCVHPL